MIVIGLTGYARVGKDTVADHLIQHHGFQKRRFADPIKDMLRRLNPIVGIDPGQGRMRVGDLYRLYGDEEGIKASPYRDEMRGLWQRLGTDCVRAIDDTFWVRAAVATLHDPDGRYVFTDCRFPNEAEAITHRGGRVWNIRRAGVEPPNTHISEAHAGRLGETLTIRNDGTLQDLFQLVDAAINTLLGETRG